MKILLTGHRGFIGSNLLQRLQQNHQVDTYEWSDGIRPGVIDYDWVIHIGAISSTTERDIEKIMRQNVDFTIDLFEECRTFGVGFQFASSASIYGLGIDFNEATAKPDPRNPYAWSKYLCERHIRADQRSIPTQVFRYFNVYGAGEDHKGNQASPYTQFRTQAARTGVIKLFENSHQYFRDFVPVERVVDVHEQMLTKKVSGVFNVGTGQVINFQQVAEQVAEESGARIEYVPMPEILKSSYQTFTCADLTRLRAALNE